MSKSKASKLKNAKLKKGTKTAEEVARLEAAAELAEAQVQRVSQGQVFGGESQDLDFSARSILPYGIAPTNSRSLSERPTCLWRTPAMPGRIQTAMANWRERGRHDWPSKKYKNISGLTLFQLGDSFGC